MLFILIKVTGDAPPASKPFRHESTQEVLSETQKTPVSMLVLNPVTTTFGIGSDKEGGQHQSAEIMDGKTIWSRKRAYTGMIIDMTAYGPEMHIVKITTPEGL